MSSLHDALRELAEEVDGVPEGLAERTWAAGRADVTRQRRTRLLASLTAVAAAAALVWIAVVSGLGRTDSAPAEPSPDELPVAVTGYPQRVVDPGHVDPLPTKGVPLTAVMHSRTRGDGGGWLALRPDGSLWSLPDLLPAKPPATIDAPVEQSGYADDQRVPLPSLDPTGRWIAAFERPADQTQPRLVIIDVTTGERAHQRNVLGGAEPSARDLVGGTCFAGPGAQLHWRPGGGSPRVALACDSDTGRQVTVVDTRGRVVTTVVVESTPGALLRTQSCTRGLAGWLDERRLLDLCLVQPHGGERLITVEVDVDEGRATELGAQRRSAGVPMLGGVIWDERNLHLRQTGTTTGLDIAWGGGLDGVMAARAADVAGSSSLVRAPTQLASAPTGADVVGSRVRVADHVIFYANAEVGVMTLNTPVDPAVSLMVVDPGLQVDAVSVAQTALHGEVTRHHLGVRTSWWSWHPWLTALALAGVLTLLSGMVVSFVRSNVRPGAVTSTSIAVVVGILLAVLVVTIAIRTTEEPAPLPSPGVTVQ
ncbi:hypothetical protein [Janibacter sp. YB324]|uniref:hypothetical protein n=1 Tax=Janibacter TaxID=53457 RepID=UPI001624E22D|nr:hypothetical protein [Janibacter sp. YB324]QNF94463.1 hypothetical protein H7A72_01070 [Janibacter sp. YB324]